MASTTSSALGRADQRAVRCCLLCAHDETLRSWEILYRFPCLYFKFEQRQTDATAVVLSFRLWTTDADPLNERPFCIYVLLASPHKPPLLYYSLPS